MLLKYVDECNYPSILDATRVFGDKDCRSIKAIDKQGNCHTLGYLDKKENVQKVFDEAKSSLMLGCFAGNTTTQVRHCTCGCDKFHAHQICRHDVVVNGDNLFCEDKGIYDSETPYGPFTCDKCGKEYDEIDDIPLPHEPN